MASSTPVLWQIKVSHYNEKARWALDYKRVPHKRRAPLPLVGSTPAALATTRRPTFPVLDSTAQRSPTRRDRRGAGGRDTRRRRCTRPTPPSARGRWSWRTSSTSSSRRTCAGSRFSYVTRRVRRSSCGACCRTSRRRTHRAAAAGRVRDDARHARPLRRDRARTARRRARRSSPAMDRIEAEVGPERLPRRRRFQRRGPGGRRAHDAAACARPSASTSRRSPTPSRCSRSPTSWSPGAPGSGCSTSTATPRRSAEVRRRRERPAPAPPPAAVSA